MFSDRRVVVATVLAALGLLAVLVLVFLHGPGRRGHGPESVGLQLQLGVDSKNTASGPDIAHCYVNGKSLGDTTLADCARRNGATGPTMDVGLDQPTAAPGNVVAQAPAPAAPMAPMSSNPAPVTAECLRYTEQGWRGYGSILPLGACVRVMFQGQCARPGEADYGRWGVQTLRLIPGRVEISDDNKHFRPLVDQNPADCSIAAM